MQKCRNAAMQKRRNAEMQKCRNAELQIYENLRTSAKITVVYSAEAATIDRKSVENLYIMNNLLNANVAIPHYIPPSFLRSPPPTPLKIRT